MNTYKLISILLAMGFERDDTGNYWYGFGSISNGGVISVRINSIRSFFMADIHVHRWGMLTKFIDGVETQEEFDTIKEYNGIKSPMKAFKQIAELL